MKITELPMAGTVREPGAYEMPAEAYLDDPCMGPSLNATLAKILISYSPLHAREAHPRLRSTEPPEPERKFDLGLAAHRVLLGKGRELEVIDAADYRSKAVQALRLEALAAGKIPILTEQYARVEGMVGAATRLLPPDVWAVASGSVEVSIFSVEDSELEDAVWLRAMVDWLSDDGRTIDDYKTTDRGADPESVSRMCAAHGWDIQAAMHERILDAIDPDNAGRRTHRFIVQECSPPYALTVAVMSEDAMTMGRKKLQYAIDLWRKCLSADRWPGYASPIMISYPRWAEAAWLAREVGEDRSEVVDSPLMGWVDLLKAG